MKTSRIALLLLATAAAVTRGEAQSTRLDSLDAFVRAQMAERRIPGVSLTIIQDGKIAVARAYGVVDLTSKAPVTTATLFQAGSISKPVSALGALHLVEAGKLSLDGDVNDKLTSWKVPENRFTATEKVTLRRLLSHNAGLTVHGFPGYDAAVALPTVVQVLDGTPPANTRPIRVDTTPGAIWRYSGGGYTVMQQMMIDVTGTPFPRYMQETVLGPIGMAGSSFEQPLPPARASLTAGGFYADRTAVRGRWHLYPEMAAAGLWTTPSDLARFAIEVQETYAGRGHGVISPAMARQYLTEQKGGSGLGVGVGGSGRSLRFGHGGRDEGFDASLNAFAETGQGLVVMINANDNSRFMARLEGFVARAWGWPSGGAQDSPAAATSSVAMTPGLLARFAGYYEAAENNMIALVPSSRGAGLQTLSDGLPDEELVPVDSITFRSSDRPFRIAFIVDPSGKANTVILRPGDPRERRAPRVAPLPSAGSDVPDPDEKQTERIKAALTAIDRGGAMLADAPDVTPGAKQDFQGGTGGALASLGSLSYRGQEDVTGRGIRRHGGEVARVKYYRIKTNTGERFLLVHLTADGTITDFDLVER